MPPSSLLFVLLLSPWVTADGSVGAGVSSNPLEMPVPAPTPGTTAPEPGVFVPLHVMGDVRGDVSDAIRAGVRGWADAEVYAWMAQDPAATAATRALDASHATAYAGAPVSWRALQGAHTLSLALEPFAGLHREVFTSPVTGRGYSAGGIDYSGRFNLNRAGARASGELELPDGTNAWGALSWQRVDYLEDFRGIPTIDRWDYGEFRLDLDTYYYPPSSEVAGAYSYRRRFYDARFPHDAAGNPILPGSAGYSPQVFDFHNFTVKGGLETERGHALLKVDVERRIDENGGYLDYWDTTVTADGRLEEGRWTLVATPAYSLRVYDVARVNFDPIEPSNRRWRIDVPLQAERHLDSQLSVWVEAGWTEQWSSNSLYTWRAFRAASGLRIRFR